MVKKEIPVFLFTGTDSASKDNRLKELKREFFNAELDQFNCDLFYAKDLNLQDLQEKILSLPLRAKKRVITIRLAHLLKPDVKKFILDFAKKAPAQTVLVLDMLICDKKDEFIKKISPLAEIVSFDEQEQIDAFTLSRQIESKHLEPALKVLNRLLENGEKPEFILGGLRYAWERQSAAALLKKKRLKLLLSCDLDIKSSRLKPAFALEKLVVSLCSLR